MQMMNQRMSLKVNPDEAKVLLVSADTDQNNVLSMDEFMDMIFSTNEALNVDLSQITKADEHLIQTEHQGQWIDKIRKDAEGKKE